MRALLIGLSLALAAGAAHAQTPYPMKLPGDFDGDGKADFVERTILDTGVWQVMVTLDARRDFPFRTIEGDDPGMGAAAIEVLPPGEYSVDVRGEPHRMTFAADVIVIDRRANTRRLIYWKDGFFRTEWVRDDE